MASAATRSARIPGRRLFAFGYGRLYTTFAYSELTVTPVDLSHGHPALAVGYTMAVGAITMSISTIVVAANAQLLRGLKLRRDPTGIAPAPLAGERSPATVDRMDLEA